MEYIYDGEDMPKEDIGELPPLTLKKKYFMGTFSPDMTLRELDEWMLTNKILDINKVSFTDSKIFMRFVKW